MGYKHHKFNSGKSFVKEKSSVSFTPGGTIQENTSPTGEQASGETEEVKWEIKG